MQFICTGREKRIGLKIPACASRAIMPSFDQKIQVIAVCILIFVIGLFYYSSLRDGHNWGGDFSMYIQHAKNISEGKPYGDTGYIYNPSYPFLGPKKYPPILPMLLVPVYLVSGFNLQAMKLVPILSFLIALFVIYLNFRNKLSFYAVCALIAIIGFNYHFWNFKDNILSDFPFLLFIYTFFYLVEKTFSPQKSFREAMALCVAAGVFLYLSYGTRSIGIILLPIILVYDFLCHKKLSPKGLLIAAFFGFLFICQNVLLPSDGSYFDQLFFNLRIVSRNIRHYQWYATTFWSNGYSYPVSEWLFIIFSIFSLWGFIFRIKQFGIYELFFLSYLAIIFIWPANQGVRFLIPIIPLYLYYFFSFFEVVKKKYLNQALINHSVSFFIGLVMCAIALSYCMLYVKRGLPAISQGIHNYYSTDIFDVVRNKSSQNDVIIFIKPRVLSLMTSRKSASYHRAKRDKDLFGYFQKIGATYLIEPINEYSKLQDPYLNAFIARNKKRFRYIYSNRDFIYYRII